MNFNSVHLAGNLTRDPELRYTPKGTAVCQFSVAINRTWVGEDGQKKEEVTFVECTAWGRTAEAIGQYLKKGRPIFVDGRLKLDTWEDKNTKEKRQKLSVVCESFHFVGNKPEGDSAPRSRPASQPASTSAPSSEPAESEAPDDGSDVPF